MKNIQPLISIVTAVYNGEQSLELTIKSIINQTYSNIEYIIIDGGSQDGTVDIIKKYENKLAHWISEADKGISDAFNKGVKLGKGQLIGLINSGDYYENNSVELIVNKYLLEKNKGTLSKYFVIHGNIKMIGNFRSKIYSPMPVESFKYQMPIWHPTLFVSANIYKDFLYNNEYKIAMDYELFSRLYGQKVFFCYLDKLITNMDVNGISNKEAKKGFHEVMVASRKNLRVGLIRSLIYFYLRCIIYKLSSLKRRIIKCR